ncbi:MAG: NAD(P)/FAD-dependent oxidoreductase, partial [Actinomycetia bacterium]|nr:NAD(P)/FAD-dependent oxidoreductase [Actinomycetes bacterium]
MEYTGHVGSDGYDEVVVRGNLDDGVVSALWIRAGTVIAGMHVNDWDAIEPLRACIGREASSVLRDTSTPLADVVPIGG